MIFSLNRFVLSLNDIYVIGIKFQCSTTKHKCSECIHGKFFIWFKKKKSCVYNLDWTLHIPEMNHINMWLFQGAVKGQMCSVLIKIRFYKIYALNLFKKQRTKHHLHLITWCQALYNQQIKSHKSYYVFNPDWVFLIEFKACITPSIHPTKINSLHNYNLFFRENF